MLKEAIFAHKNLNFKLIYDMTVLKNKRQFIEVKGAKIHNLKNIDVNIPRNSFVVVTGLSGSGKSSLAFDTLYAEGQRRYVESLSSYARQFLGRINKPEVDYIKGIPPAIAIEQKVNTRNPRSTVGTSTEIYDYIKLLYARIGKTISPVSNTEVKRHSVTDVVNYLCEFQENTKALIVTTVYDKAVKKAVFDEQILQTLMQQGYSRIVVENDKNCTYEIFKISDFVNNSISFKKIQRLLLIIDRIVIQYDDDTKGRMADSVQTAFFEGKGTCAIKILDDNNNCTKHFSSIFEADGIVFEEPTIHTFSFNTPAGACKMCEGFGKVTGIEEDLVIPEKSLSVYEGAIACWKGEKMGEWLSDFLKVAHKFNFPIHKPYIELSEDDKKLLWTGNKYFEGLNSFFKMLENEQYKIQYRVMLSRYKGKTVCPECKGTRLKKEAGYIKVGGKSIHELVLMPITKLQNFFYELKLPPFEELIAKRLLLEIQNRIDFLKNVGLGYLTLNRLSSSLSGGESQRINLSTSLGSSLVGSLYILDEPSIGLHPRDTNLLIGVLRNLKEIGNTVLVVEHEEEIMRAADQIIDIGPFAGRNGGEIVFQGTMNELMENPVSLTAQYLSGKQKIDIPEIRRKWNNYVQILNAAENNLKNISVKFPLYIMTVVTGVSGSGKTSLVRNVLYNALSKNINGYSNSMGRYGSLVGDIKLINSIEMVDQNPIGKSSRSNPVTYIKAYDEIRKLFAQQQSAVINLLTPSHFSFNIDGGRCDTCQGDGFIKVEMQFMADVTLVCEHCNGQRFKPEVLSVLYRNKTIHDVLNMTVDEAIAFFSEKNETVENRIVAKLQLLIDVGLGYIQLGQASSTLSGGESQRVKLASFLSKENDSKHGFFIFDEPTTGLHFHDIKILLKAFNALINKGNTVVVIEHNAEVIKSADWVIDIGLEGGEEGGYIVFEGTPENLAKHTTSYTGNFLKQKLL